jgi:hypothetical protein
MEWALTLASIASFFALVVSWTVLPTSERSAKTAPGAVAAQAS